MLGFLASFVLSRRRRIVLESLSFLRPELTPAQRQRMARRTFANFAGAAVDLFRLPTATPKELAALVPIDGLAHVDAALARGRGAIIVGAHLGPYELGAACFASLGYRTYGVAEDLPPEVMKALTTVREATGMQIIDLTRAVVGTLRALKENAVVMLVSDRVVGRGTVGVELPFAHGFRPVPTGPAGFAVSTGAPILVGYIVRKTGPNGQQYQGYVEPPMYVEKRGEAGSLEITRRVTERLAALVALHADEWYVFQPQWRPANGS
jgi:KDO2-lipid IV(A) lauroyltransferase